jgi:alkylation response protein AidB-like acyl-CoA dehydrogenase
MSNEQTVFDPRDTPGLGYPLDDEHERFRAEFAAWLATHVPADPTPADESERFERGRAWQRLLAEEGWAGIAWPVEYGGRGADAVKQLIYYDCLAWANAPDLVNTPGLLLAGPTLMVHGTPELKSRLLPRILSATDIWCQGFSEPDYGSDLGSVKTRAFEENGRWVIDGQKVWTTHAPWATHCFVLCRTAEPHRGRRYDGLSMIICEMNQPEVHVTPLRQPTGDSEFAHVLFNRATAPIDAVIGGAGDGWNVSMTMLEFERSEQGFTDHSRLLVRLEEIRAFVAAAEASGALAAGQVAAIQTRFVDLWSRCQLLGQFNLGRALALDRGEKIGSWGSYMKLYWSELWQAIAELGLDVVGPSEGADGFAFDYLDSRASTIYSGTSEIQRNVIGERLLGLPR